MRDSRSCDLFTLAHAALLRSATRLTILAGGDFKIRAKGRRPPPRFTGPRVPPSMARGLTRIHGHRSRNSASHTSVQVCSQELRVMAPLTLKPSLSSGQFAEGPSKHALRISFRPNRQCARLAKSRSGSVAVRVRTTKEQQVAHARLSQMSHGRRERMNAA
jgi:hypothetical protein